MKKKMNLTAIIAVAMVAMSVLVLGSCNADDDYNEFDYGTLAGGIMTRAAESKPQPKHEVISDTVVTNYTIVLSSDRPDISHGKYSVNFSTMMYTKDSIPVLEMLGYSIEYCASNDTLTENSSILNVDNFRADGISLVKDANPHDRYYLYASGTNELGVSYSGKLEGLLFFAK